jgi:hypothetical protein
VILGDFAGRRCCSREIVINGYANLDELISILCAAVAFTDNEHLWRLQLPEGTVEGGQWARPTTPEGKTGPLLSEAGQSCVPFGRGAELVVVLGTPHGGL